MYLNESAVYHGGEKILEKHEKKNNPNYKHFELWKQGFNLMLVFHTKRNVTAMNESEMCVEIIPCQRLWDVES